jgi:Ca2+-binding EF-hand superfamily protein
VQLDAALKPGAVEIMKKQTSPKRARSQAPSGPLKAVTIEGLRAALTANRTRVIDAFRKLDKDSDGTITKAEFRGALPLLGFDASRTDLTDELFKTLDSDGGGTISFDELNQKLRQGAGVELAAELKAGAVGAIELKARNKIAPGSSHRHLLGEQGSSIVLKKVTVAGVREALAASYSRVIDFFKLMDKNGDGIITWDEFVAAAIDKVALLNKQNIRAAFEVLDENGDGRITKEELKNKFEGSSNENPEEVMWEEIIKEACKDGCGSITWNEFKTCMNKVLK